MNAVQKLINKLHQHLGNISLLTGDNIGEKYAVDFTGENYQPPLAVIRPKTTEEVSLALKTCSALSQRVVIQGGLTGLAGGATPKPNEVAISLEQLSGIEEIDTTSMTLTALAGTPLQTIQEAAENAGLMFPLDYGARGSCQIGGAIATNAGGNQVIRFGMTRNLVLGLEAVLADGTIVSSMNKMLKNNSGYDLKQLFIGTEGTLGIVTRAVLRLYHSLPSRCTSLCTVQTFSQSVELLRETQKKLGTSLSAYEVMWAPYFERVINHVENLQSPFAENYPLYVLIETEGSDQESDSTKFEEMLEAALENKTIQDAVVAQSEKDRQDFWDIRDGVGEITQALMPYASLDISMDIANMPKFLEDFDRSLSKTFPQALNLVFGHLGDNNLHLFVTTQREQDINEIYSIGYKLTGKYEGAITAEHGVGELKRSYLHHSRTPEEIDLMRRLKKTLDPEGILNMGRVIPD
ncbi:MAG: oxidoreductase [Rhodospirillaceae bacterium]|nr:oxidoreductase [Rhodospirillaceae bacterium]|tara:strand:- start:1790 stop:3181 length:1392 start_codon:yes stop_codon:yes gene_type:complete